MSKLQQVTRWNVRQINGRWFANDPITGKEIEASSECALLALIDSLEIARSIPTIDEIGARFKNFMAQTTEARGEA